MRHAPIAALAAFLTACAAPAPPPRAPDAPPAPAPETRPEAAPPAAPEPGPRDAADRYVVVVSLDGARHDYIDRAATPNLDRLGARGVRAEALVPSYPSKTFPNHYTLATGLRPSRHGIVDNAFYDPALDAMYRLGDEAAVTDGRWYGGEPIWVTAERQGLRAASFFWVGSEAEIRGRRPSFVKAYDHDFPFDARVDTVLHWLSLPEPGRPRLVMLYYAEPDATAHARGPDHPDVLRMMSALDRVIGRLLDGVDALPIADRVSVIVLSDHGMGPAPAEQVLHIEDLVDLDGARVVHNGTQALLYFDGHEERMMAAHEALAERLRHASVHLREETPARWHYRDNARIGDLVVVADPGWMIVARDGRPWRGGGMHGWDNRRTDMHGIFLAAGPDIPAGSTLPAFDNVHVHAIIARLLGIDPAPGLDGDGAPFEAILAPEPAARR